PPAPPSCRVRSRWSLWQRRTRPSSPMRSSAPPASVRPCRRASATCSTARNAMSSCPATTLPSPPTSRSTRPRLRDAIGARRGAGAQTVPVHAETRSRGEPPAKPLWSFSPLANLLLLLSVSAPPREAIIGRDQPMAELIEQPLVMEGQGWADYGLVDSGQGRKLERYGRYRFIRPEGQALWSPRLAEWDADGEFVPGSDEDGGGRWQYTRSVPREGWPLSWNDVRFTAPCTTFRHLGFFPDMAPVWDWMRERLRHSGESRDPVQESSTSEARGPRSGPGRRGCLNLFGYTGVGTLALSECGPVTHVDASKKSVAQ